MNRVTVGALYCPRCDRKFRFSPAEDKAKGMAVVRAHIAKAHPEILSEFEED